MWQYMSSCPFDLPFLLCLPFSLTCTGFEFMQHHQMLLMLSNYEKRAHLERRQKSAPFPISQLSPPPHHVFLKPGTVPNTKCIGKHILGPAVIWPWSIGCGWIRNQLIAGKQCSPCYSLGVIIILNPPFTPHQTSLHNAGEGLCNTPWVILSRQPCSERQLSSVLNDTLCVEKYMAQGLL